MRMVRFRLDADNQKVDAIIALLHEMDSVDRVEEVADQMHERDDVSSLDSPSDAGPDFHYIEVHARSANAAEEVRNRIEIAARDLDVAVEFVDEF
jgi:hypothetical protein